MLESLLKHCWADDFWCRSKCLARQCWMCLGQLIFPILLSYYFTDDTLIVAQGSAAMWRAWTESTRAVSASTCLLPEFLGSSARCCKMLQRGGKDQPSYPRLSRNPYEYWLSSYKTKVVHAAVKTRGTTRERKSLECQQDGPAGLSLTPVASASSSDVWDCLGLSNSETACDFSELVNPDLTWLVISCDGLTLGF